MPQIIGLSFRSGAGALLLLLVLLGSEFYQGYGHRTAAVECEVCPHPLPLEENADTLRIQLLKLRIREEADALMALTRARAETDLATNNLSPSKIRDEHSHLEAAQEECQPSEPPEPPGLPAVMSNKAPVNEVHSTLRVTPPKCRSRIDEITGKHCGRLYLAHWVGRFGNRMFQFAYACEFGRTHFPTEVFASKWEGSIIFESSSCAAITGRDDPLREALAPLTTMSEGDNVARGEVIRRHARAYPGWNPPRFWHPEIEPNPLWGDEKVPDVWFTSLHMMFDRGMRAGAAMDRGHIRDLFHFSDRVRKTKVYQWLEARRGSYDVAHVRRDDIVQLTKNEGRYCNNCVVSLGSYERAMKEAQVDPTAVLWISDDPALATPQWWHDELREIMSHSQVKWEHPQGEPVIPSFIFPFLPDFLLMVFARKIFRANSAFGFWGAFLNREQNNQVYSPDMSTCVPAPDSQFTSYDCHFSAHNRNHWMSAGLYNEPWDEIEFS